MEFGETADHALPWSDGHFVVFLSLERQLTTLCQGQMAILLSFLVWRDSLPHSAKVRWPFCCLVCPVCAVEFAETADHALPRSDGHFIVCVT